MVSDAAMWMPGKSGRVIVEVIVTEIVQQEKWIEQRKRARPERTPELDARAVSGWFCIDHANDVPLVARPFACGERERGGNAGQELAAGRTRHALKIARMKGCLEPTPERGYTRAVQARRRRTS